MKARIVSYWLDRHRDVFARMMDEHQITKAIAHLGPRLRDKQIKVIWDRVLQREKPESTADKDRVRNGFSSQKRTAKGHDPRAKESYYRGFYHGAQTVLCCIRLAAQRNGSGPTYFPYRK